MTAEQGGHPGSDLPAAIGRPATRALHGAGLTRLDQVATWTEAELLALHGVLPKAVRILGEALTERGLSLPRREHSAERLAALGGSDPKAAAAPRRRG